MMPLQPLRRRARNILVRMLLLGAVAAGVIVWQADFLLDVYLRNQLTSIGWIANSAIVVLFLAGLARIIQILWKYMREEAALAAFVGNLCQDAEDPTEGLSVDSIIVARYRTLHELNAQGASINHSALAATLAGITSMDASFPKFVNNVLILTGVLGTIIALSIALLGASDMLGGGGEITGMGTVIHGMSTALSTTMTAIFCYLFFGYFYLKLTDAQTNLLSNVEQVTATALIPRFQPPAETTANQFTNMLRAARDLLERLQQAHTNYAAAGERLQDTLELYRLEQQTVGRSLTSIRHLLREGFRLPEQKE